MISIGYQVMDIVNSTVLLFRHHWNVKFQSDICEMKTCFFPLSKFMVSLWILMEAKETQFKNSCRESC